jgi:hypothetical protein
MGEVVSLEERRRKTSEASYPIIRKVVDGEVIECVDVDALSPAQYAKWRAVTNAPRHAVTD